MARQGQFTKGNPGKPKGAVSHTTRLVKDVFAEVFNEIQEHPKAKLSVWAKDNPTEFYKLASKLIPIQLGGTAENPLVLTVNFKPAQGCEPLTNYTEDDCIIK